MWPRPGDTRPSAAGASAFCHVPAAQGSIGLICRWSGETSSVHTSHGTSVDAAAYTVCSAATHLQITVMKGVTTAGGFFPGKLKNNLRSNPENYGLPIVPSSFC